MFLYFQVFCEEENTWTMLEGEVPTQERVFQVSILLKSEIIFVNFETQVSILLKIIFVKY